VPGTQTVTLTIGILGAAPVRPYDTVMAAWLAASVVPPVPPAPPVLLVPPLPLVLLELLLVLPSDTLLDPPPPHPEINTIAAAKPNALIARTHLLVIRNMPALVLVRYWMSAALTPAGKDCGR
jgi:hypothetical protein